MKKLVSVLLAVILVCSVVPMAISANAAGEGDKPTPIQVNNINVQNQDATQPATEAQETTGVQETTQAPTETQPATEATTAAPTEPTTVEKITPKKVTGFGATKIAATYVTLKWNLSKDATKYIIQRSEANGKGNFDSFVNVGTVNGSTNSFTNKGLASSIIYQYKIFAVREADGYVTQSEAAATTILTCPKDIKSIKVTKKGTNSVSIKWTDLASFGGTYYVYRSVEQKNGKMSKFSFYKELEKNYINDIELSSGTVYKYMVFAVTNKGPYYSESNAKYVKFMTKLDTPAKFLNKGISEKGIKLAWSKVPHAAKYQLYRKAKGHKNKLIATLTSRKYLDKKVKSGVKYRYKVRGIRVYNGKTYKGGTKAVNSTDGVRALAKISGHSSMNCAVLSWEQVPGVDGYKVLRLSNRKWVNAGKTTSCAFQSKRYKTGTVVAYAVRGFRKISGNTVYGPAKKIKIKITAGTARGSSPTGTWVEVNINTQTMYMYVKNKLYVSTPVVTGNVGDRATSKGTHQVLSKKSPARLRGSYGGSSWDTTVNYWLGFTGNGQGLHDATWRSAFGGSIYKGNGSHGCVNTPLSAMAKIYAKAYIGMPIFVY